MVQFEEILIRNDHSTSDYWPLTFDVTIADSRSAPDKILAQLQIQHAIVQVITQRPRRKHYNLHHNLIRNCEHLEKGYREIAFLASYFEHGRFVQCYCTRFIRGKISLTVYSEEKLIHMSSLSVSILGSCKTQTIADINDLHAKNYTHIADIMHY